MCGIAGRLHGAGTDSRLVVQAMIRRLAHRGPDAEGVLQLDGICLGHRRLSVLDVSDAANQPMVDGSGRYTVVFNGEIYNFKDLRAQLIQHGQVFRTQGDTEVLLAAYAVWGIEGLQRINGMFAFALWGCT